MLDELQLKYVIHNEVLLITSPDKGRKRRVHGNEGLSGGGPGRRRSATGL